MSVVVLRIEVLAARCVVTPVALEQMDDVAEGTAVALMVEKKVLTLNPKPYILDPEP